MLIRLVLMYLLLFTALYALEENNSSRTIPYGYGTLSLGAQTTFYKENYISSNGDEIHSEFVTTSPYILTGSQTRINRKFSFSIMAASTLFSSSSKEEYFNNDVAFDTHKATYTLTELAVNVQYRINKLQQLSFGANYTYESLKRYAYSSAALQDINASMIESRVATLNTTVGYRYSNHSKAGENRWRYVLSIEAGLPILIGRSSTLDTYRRNQLALDQGYSIKPNIYLGYKLIKGLEFGMYMDYLFKYRHENFPTSYTSSESHQVTLVDSYQSNTRYGLALSWNYTAFEILDELR